MRTMTAASILVAVLFCGCDCSVEVTTGDSAVVLTVETDGSLSGKVEGTGRNSFSWRGSETEKTFVQEARELGGDPILRIDGTETLDPDTGTVQLALTLTASRQARFKVEGITVDSLTVDGEAMSFPVTFAPGTFQVAVSGGMQ